MNRKNYLKLSFILPIILGIIIGAVLFWLGELDDAPGLCLIGIVIGFLLVLCGFYNANFIKKQQLIHVISLCFGTGLLVMTVVLQLDGEFEETPFAFYIGISLGVILICVGIIRWLDYKRKKYKY